VMHHQRVGPKEKIKRGQIKLTEAKRKDNGFQDDEKSLSVYTYPFLDEPHGNENSKLDETNNNRPLDETELAWILAAKYKGFMVKGTKAYKKARRAAAQLAGHYVLGKSFAEIAKIVDGKENSVNRFCTRSRKEYADNMVRGPMPEGVRTALAKGLLRELYPPAVTTGYLVRSA